MNKGCINCENAIWDPIWAEWICAVSQKKIFKAKEECEYFKKGEPKESKNTYEK